MVGEIFQIYGVQITGKCICQSNIYYALWQNYPLVSYYHHPDTGKLFTLPSPEEPFLWKFVPQLVERGGEETIHSL